MNSKLYSTFLAMAFLPLSQLAAQVPTDGLVAFYRFSGNAADSSGNGNHGTVNGALLDTDRFGKANSAYLFDGVDDYIEVASSSTLTPDSQVTVSAWVNITDLSTENWIVDKRINVGSSPYSSYSLYCINDKWKAGVSTVNGIAGPGVTTITTGVWHHVALTYDGSALTLYLDGMIESQQSLTGTISYSSLPLYIGKSPNNAAFTKGKIDDIRIYERALDSAEISLLVNEVGVGFGDRAIKEQVSIYPNPASTQITIDTRRANVVSSGTIVIYDNLGRQVYSTRMENGLNVLDVSEIQKEGIYFIHLVNEDGELYCTKSLLLGSF